MHCKFLLPFVVYSVVYPVVYYVIVFIQYISALQIHLSLYVELRYSILSEPLLKMHFCINQIPLFALQIHLETKVSEKKMQTLNSKQNRTQIVRRDDDKCIAAIACTE